MTRGLRWRLMFFLIAPLAFAMSLDSGNAAGIVSGWTNSWGNADSLAGPVLTAYLVRWTGTWPGALICIALAGIAGAMLWLFVHPQRRLAALAQ